MAANDNVRNASERDSTVLSIIIPCFNQGLFLSDAIESALAQSYPGIEVIVVDDGSTDDTAEVTARYPTVRYVRQQNLGLAEARNTGYRVSGGEYVEFLDADDRLTSNAAEAHLSCLASHPEADFVVGDIDHMRFDGSYQGSPRWPLLEGDHYRELLRANHVANTIAVLFRRQVIDRIGGFKSFGSPAEDYDLLLSASRLFESVHHRTVVAHYRRYPTSLSRQGARMLRAMHRVMRLQWPMVEGNQQLMKAWREGELYWRDHFGIAAMKELFASLLGLDFRRAALAIVALIRYVRGRMFLLLWNHRSRVWRVMRRSLGQGRRSDRRKRAAIPR